MTENGSAGTKSSPESGVAGSGQAQAVQQNVASPVSTPVGTPVKQTDLSHRAKSAAFDVAREARPWREDQSWWVVGIEGLVVLLVGIYAAGSA